MSDYPGDLGCRWTIANSGPGPLTLSFASPFWLETGYTHCYDTLTITDTNTGDTVTLCGDEVLVVLLLLLLLLLVLQKVPSEGS